MQQLHAERVADIEEDAALVPVEVVEEARVVERGLFTVDRAAQADGVGSLAVFNADDIGAEIGEDTRGRGPGDDPGQVANADAGEGQIGHGPGL